ncbi:deoxyribonuclease V [Marinobacter sp. NFXS9]|uniref:deoxyribonuclease V n=1 Tax=Marinobacter sp. NFXS9 TaxID=2818433 RepID=UPI0032E023C5
MLPDLSAEWADLTPKDAIALQQSLRAEVNTDDDLPEVRTVAGVDVGFEDHGQTARAAIVILDRTDLTPVDYALARLPTRFPYVPGLLSFRECPVILEALKQLKTMPDLLLCDGQGIAHPRRLGIATHIGLLTGLPSIGVGKSRLTGTHGPVPDTKGEWTPLVDGDETIGAVLRTRSGVKPLFISPGHRISLPTAIDVVMACITRYRLPETTRWADGLASNRGQQWLKNLESLK